MPELYMILDHTQNRGSVYPMALDKFIASIDDCPAEDLLSLSQILRLLLPEHTDALRTAARLPAVHRIRTVRHILKGILHTLEREENMPADNPPARQRHRTLEQQEDHALNSAQSALSHISDGYWTKLALQMGKSADEVRQETWAKVFKILRKYD